MSRTQRIFSNPMHDVVFSSFTTFFDNPTMTKVLSTQNKSVYAVKVKCSLNMHRYIIITTREDELALGTRRKLGALIWESFQTRSFENEEFPNLEQYNYLPMNKPPMNSVINKDDSRTTEESVTYTSSTLPIDVTLLLSKNSRYGKFGTIAAGLEEYQTIVTMIG